jgi:AmpD protein
VSIAGHADIAPGRKTDPGACFNWSRLRNSLTALEDLAAK